MSAQGLELRDEAPDVQFPACLEALAKLKPREEGFAEVLLPMFETSLKEDVQVPDADLPDLMHTKKVEWDPDKALHIHNCRFVLSKGKMYYIHLMYRVQQMGGRNTAGSSCAPKDGPLNNVHMEDIPSRVWPPGI